jgi:leucyl-tRNA---protein transferase
MCPTQQISHWPSWPLPLAPTDVQTTPRHACTYLPGRWATFRAFEADAPVSGDAYQRLLDAGFRRSGSMIYQPMCAGCRQCVPLRVPVDTFRPSKSQRRVLNKNQDVVVHTHTPEATPEKWELYDRYQRQWHLHRAAGSEEVLEFVTFLYRSPVPSVEFEYRDRWDKLLGVGIGDLCPISLSSVYFYFDPREAWRSPGTFSALYEIQWARENHLHHWYAGYWIQHCPAMSYKSRFRPCETLSTDGQWRSFEDALVGAGGSTS